jgi:8-oxo-dGTP pyrophosphatase MutT (NUDIX family)
MAKRGNRQIAALPFRVSKAGVEILLITSRETKRWVIPKGWPMDGFKDYNSARVEAFEEAGVGGHMTRKCIGKFSYQKLYATNGTKTLRVGVYALEVKTVLRSWPEKSERKRQWFPATEAAALVNEKELRTLILRFSPTPTEESGIPAFAGMTG